MNLPKIKSVMTAFPYSIEADAGIDDALEMMNSHQIRHLPVTEQHKLIGIVSQRDAQTATALGEKFAKQVLVGDVCTRDPYSVDMSTPLVTVVSEMAERRIGSVVVMKNEKIAGIFTTTDACAYLAELLGGSPPDDLEQQRA